jgi:uncharacterized protein (TIGR04255 family)
MTISGRVFESLQQDFALKEMRINQQIEIHQTPQGPRQQLSSQELAVFLVPNRKTFIQVGPRLLTVHILFPYPGWEKYQLAIDKAYQSILRLIPEPQFERIGLRYINKFHIKSESFGLSDYFDYFPYCGEMLKQPFNEFAQTCNFVFFDGQDACRVQFKSVPAEQIHASAFVLDMDYYLQQKDYVNANTAMGWVQRAHTQIEAVFEGCLKDSLRSVLHGTVQ